MTFFDGRRACLYANTPSPAYKRVRSGSDHVTVDERSENR